MKEPNTRITVFEENDDQPGRCITFQVEENGIGISIKRDVAEKESIPDFQQTLQCVRAGSINLHSRKNIPSLYRWGRYRSSAMREE